MKTLAERSRLVFEGTVAVLACAIAVSAAEPRCFQARKVTAQPDAIDGGAPTMADFTNGTTGDAATVQTRAQVSFDAQRLYFVVECSEPNMGALRARCTGHDNAEVFSDDCIEIFLCPGKSQKEYYHLVVNAAAARYDEKVKDKSWNSGWTATAMEGETTWTVRIAIPFSDLGEKPGPDSVWWFNVDRQRQAGGKLVLSSWSPTGENFHSVRHFGRLVFSSDYAACLKAEIIEPWDRRVAALRDRAKIDAPAAKALEDRIAGSKPRLQSVRAAKPESLDAFARHLATGEEMLHDLAEAAQALDGAVTKIEVARAMRTRAGPGRKILAYAVRAVTNDKILPHPVAPDRVSTVLRLRACRGEYEPASFVVYPFEELVIDSVTVTDLRNAQSTIPSSAVDVCTVKCWYQSGGTGRFPFNKGLRLLTPELLLKDDSLVRVDYEQKHNYVRLSFLDGKQTWLCVSGKERSAEERRIRSGEQPIYDARTLQPVALPAHHAKQFWLTVHVPADAPSGRYTGTLSLSSREVVLQTLELELDVLPFDLAPNPLESSVYFHWGIELDVTGNGTVRHSKRSVEQYRVELANLVAHGVDNPTLGVRYESGLLGLALWLRKEAGMRTDRLYYLIASAGLPTETIEHIIEIARRFGYEEVYFYGQDEARGDKLKAQRALWERLHEAGGKVFVAGSQGHNFPALGDLQDLLVCYGDPSKEEAARWHSKDHKIFCYANPQSGIEEPETYRRNFGLLLAANDYDGGMTYIFYHGWNDFYGKRYRQHNFVYPTADGLIDTIQWEGYREGIDDLRYWGTLRNAIAQARKLGGERARLAAEADAFLETMDVTGDLYELRNRMIEWILKLRA